MSLSVRHDLRSHLRVWQHPPRRAEVEGVRWVVAGALLQHSVKA